MAAHDAFVARRARFDSEAPDLLAPGLRAVFCGINPGHVSAAAGLHFANPRNDFWRLLYEAGFTPRLLAPAEGDELLRLGFGITNAAARTTRGSSDLRRTDFAGSAARLERVAAELRPGAIAFVGKEAYRGVFGERPELGVQARRLADSWLFVLPSTSPANAAVPYDERLRWFRALATHLETPRLRVAARAIVLDRADRVLLVRFRNPQSGVTFWATPGGALEAGETYEQAVRRELAEEAGITSFELGPWVWEREHVFEWLGALLRQHERFFVVRVNSPEVRPGLSEELLRAEGLDGSRWWTVDEIGRSDENFAPRALASLLRAFAEEGPPPRPIHAGP